MEQQNGRVYILHHNDPDGDCSAAVVAYYEREEKKYDDIRAIAVDYKMSLDDIKALVLPIPHGSKLYIVDFSFKEPVWRFISEQFRAEEVTWIDHHKTAVDTPGFWHCYRGVREDGKHAACKLTYKFLFPHRTIPDIVNVVSDHDTWAYSLMETEVFINGYETFANNPLSNDWVRLLDGDMSLFSSICAGGTSILKYRKNEAVKYLDQNGFITYFEGHKCLACNRAMMNSKLFDAHPLAKKFDIYIPFVFDGLKYTCSLYAYKSSIDVSLIAAKYGGGGHPQASGFVCSVLPFVCTHKLSEYERYTDNV